MHLPFPQKKALFYHFQISFVAEVQLIIQRKRLEAEVQTVGYNGFNDFAINLLCHLIFEASHLFAGPYIKF